MCGIFGWNLIGAQVGRPQRAIMAAILGERNDTRGGDSWGYVDVMRRGVEKGLGDIVERALEVSAPTVLMAHTRKATTGAITRDNAHPFLIGDLIGCHNGMISNHRELNTKYTRSHEVDSAHIFSHMHEGRDFTELEGYGTIEWLHRNDPVRDRVHLCRIERGELAVFGIGKDPKNYQGVVWSSSPAHAQAALKAAGLPHFNFSVDEHAVYYVAGGRYYYDDKERKIRISSWVRKSTTTYSSSYPSGQNVIALPSQDNLADALDEKDWMDALDAGYIPDLEEWEALDAHSRSNFAHALTKMNVSGVLNDALFGSAIPSKKESKNARTSP